MGNAVKWTLCAHFLKPSHRGCVVINNPWGPSQPTFIINSVALGTCTTLNWVHSDPLQSNIALGFLLIRPFPFNAFLLRSLVVILFFLLPVFSPFILTSCIRFEIWFCSRIHNILQLFRGCPAKNPGITSLPRHKMYREKRLQDLRAPVLIDHLRP